MHLFEWKDLWRDARFGNYIEYICWESYNEPYLHRANHFVHIQVCSHEDMASPLHSFFFLISLSCIMRSQIPVSPWAAALAYWLLQKNLHCTKIKWTHQLFYSSSFTMWLDNAWTENVLVGFVEFQQKTFALYFLSNSISLCSRFPLGWCCAPSQVFTSHVSPQAISYQHGLNY